MSIENGQANPVPNDAELNEFDLNLNSFLDPDYVPPEKAAVEDKADGAVAGQGDAVQGTDQPVIPLAETAPSADSNKAPSNGQLPESPAPKKDDEVDPALLLSLFTGSKPDTSQGEQQTEAKQPEAQAEQPFVPFNVTQMQIPPELVQGLFEAEDTQTRQQALNVLLAGMGNSIVAVVEQRIKDYFQPQFAQSVVTQINQRNEHQKITDDFYNSFPELKGYEQMVARAFSAVAQVKPQAKYNEVKDQVAALTRKALTQMGMQIGQTQQQNASVTNAGSQPKKQPFVAGGARPGSFQAEDSNSAAAHFDELSEW